MKVPVVVRTFVKRRLEWDLLPPALLYFGLGLVGITSIANTFFVKEYLGLSAAFLSSVAFWVGIPWALKMPLGHLVDSLGRWKHLLVVAGVALLECSVFIFLGLMRHPDAMLERLPVETWYLLASIFTALGIVLQDVVADGLSVEIGAAREAASSNQDDDGQSHHTSVQTVARVATLVGAFLAGAYNVFILSGADSLSPADRLELYAGLYEWARLVPLLGLVGVFSAVVMGIGKETVREETEEEHEAGWPVLLMSGLFVAFIIGVGLFVHARKEEVVFFGSLLLLGGSIWWLSRKIDPASRITYLTVIVLVFLIRATPSVGAGMSWWEIDVLGFDEGFFARLLILGYAISIVSMVLYRRLFADRPMWLVYTGYLAITTILSLPFLGMYYGLHLWTAQVTHGFITARVIALVDTAIDSPLSEVAMLPALAVTSKVAPARFRTTFFEVTASFLNIGTSAAALGTKYLNQVYVVTREVVDTQGNVIVPADYSQLGTLLIIAIGLEFIVPMVMLGILKLFRVKGW